MKAIVGVKRVIDYTVKIRVKQDLSGVEKNSIKFSINPFCEIAIEEAVRLKEKGIISHITALTIGDKNSTEILRHSLALGADEGIHILYDHPIDTNLSSLTVSNIFKSIINKDKYQLVFLGKQSIDSDFNQTAQMLSGQLNWPLTTFTSELKHEKDNKFFALREIDNGLEKIEIEAPFVISCDLRLNTPRYSSLKAITTAKKKKITTLKIDEIGINVENPIKFLKMENPPNKMAGIKVKDVDELVLRLKNEAKLI